MNIEPARIEQVRMANDGHWVTISADASSVAADLQAIDKGLKVRFAESGNPPFWAVYHESEDGRETRLVLTAQAYQSKTGVWTGLDDRVVKRIQYIDPEGRGHYQYVQELDRMRARRDKEQRDAFHERMGETAERAAYELRKVMGERYKGRIFK